MPSEHLIARLLPRVRVVLADPGKPCARGSFDAERETSAAGEQLSMGDDLFGIHVASASSDSWPSAVVRFRQAVSK